MKKYRYKAKTHQGQKASGLIEAVNEKSAVALLRSKQLVVISLQEAGRSSLLTLLEYFQRVSTNDVVNFTRQLSTMINAGLPLTDALKSLQEQAKPAFAKVLSEVLNDVRGGQPLYQALDKHPKIFSKVYVALVRSGETAGVLDKVLKKLAKNLEKKRRFAAKVKGAMIYPIIVVIAMMVVGFLMMTLVVPKLLDMYRELGADLPLPTQIMISLAGLFTSYWWLFLMIVFGSIYAFTTWKKTPSGRRVIDAFWFKVPLIGLLKEKIILVDLTRTLSLLVGTGVSIIDSLNIISKAAGNIIFEEAIAESAKEVEKGLPLANSLGKYEFFPSIVTQMVAVGEETGKLDEVLERVSIHFEEESDIALKALTSAIEPMMIIVLGLGVGFLVIAIIMPIYNLTAQF